MSDRIAAARDVMSRLSLDALLVWSPANVRHLCGFTGSEGALVIGTDRVVFVTDSRYETQVKEQLPVLEARISSRKIEALAGVLGDLGARRAGFEDETVTVGRRHALGRAAEAVEWVGVGEALNLLRVRKSPEEIAKLKRAAAVAERAWERVRGRLVPGVSERDMAIELEYAMRQEGATGPSFETIVASGPRGALPHGVASDRRIAEGDVVVVDWGCVFEGYCSDQTISVMVGDVGDEARRVYDVVFAAQSAALARLAPGAALREVDAAARDLIAAAGYGDYFGHGLGHGVGLEVHEAPRVAATSEAVAEAGMVVTIEPGVYLPGRFGIRLEDTVAVTADGYERITTLDKAPPSAA